ncbi:MAG: CinA family nicotinamide mononucleotide deamidase-related protein [Chlamydiales bacterium]|nr:CinA family nicotinamide mononucleotide deamidase-related protein [Chlamydiales bacterium]
MRVAVVAIGNEILSGITVNSNAAYISKELFLFGLQVTSHRVFSDDVHELEEGLRGMLSSYDIVICTGGLGPTCDDRTRQVAAILFDSEFVCDEVLERQLEERYGKNTPSLKDQATYPKKAYVLQNMLGTAPGFLFKDEKRMLILMPGVPHEMKQMFQSELIPYLKKNITLSSRPFQKKLCFCRLLEVHVDPLIRSLESIFPDVEFGIYPSLGLLSVVLKTYAQDEILADEKLDPPLKMIKEAFLKFFYESPSGTLEEAIHLFCTSSKKTLSFAESCTGGSLASKMTALTGASKYFKGSIVAYANEVKEHVLGVSSETLATRGAVSEETVKEMARGVKLRMNTDFSIAVSGIAGPDGGSVEKPVGTVCAAIAYDSEVYAWTFQADGTREMIINYSVNEVLGTFWQRICKQYR